MVFPLDPNLAYAILMVGMVLTVLAMFAPGSGLLEVAAVACIVFVGYAAMRLGINWWAALILVLGIVPFVFALRKSKNWWYLIIVMAAVIIGSYFLFPVQESGASLNIFLVVILSILSIVLIWAIGRKSIEAYQLDPDMDLSRLIGATAVTRTDVHNEGTVYVAGEEWAAMSERPIPAETEVKVIGRHGLFLDVEPIESDEKPNPVREE